MTQEKSKVSLIHSLDSWYVLDLLAIRFIFYDGLCFPINIKCKKMGNLCNQEILEAKWLSWLMWDMIMINLRINTSYLTNSVLVLSALRVKNWYPNQKIVYVLYVQQEWSNSMYMWLYCLKISLGLLVSGSCSCSPYPLIRELWNSLYIHAHRHIHRHTYTVKKIICMW